MKRLLSQFIKHKNPIKPIIVTSLPLHIEYYATDIGATLYMSALYGWCIYKIKQKIDIPQKQVKINYGKYGNCKCDIK